MKKEVIEFLDFDDNQKYKVGRPKKVDKKNRKQLFFVLTYVGLCGILRIERQAFAFLNVIYQGNSELDMGNWPQTQQLD